jgi:hypothetical protein
VAAPVININTTGAKGLTNIATAESTETWGGFNDGTGGTPSVQDETDVFIQGSQAKSIKASGSSQDKGLWYDTTTGVDMTTTGRHLYVWAAVTTVGTLSNISAGGIYIKVASDASGNNWNKYYVGGADVTTDAGFVRYVIDLNKTPSETAATAATLTSIRWFGLGVKGTISAKSENVICDRMDYGDGLQIEAGDATDPAAWQALFDDDDSSSNKYGIIEQRGGIFYLKGGLTIGDPAGTVATLWDDATGAVVEFENPLYYNGTALVSSVDGPNLYQLEVQGNATGTTDVTFGDVIGSGDSRQGVNGGTIQTAGPCWTWDSETDIGHIDSVNFYGVTLRRAGVTQFSSSLKTDIIGCTFINCDEIQANTVEFLNNTVIEPMPDRGLEMVALNSIKQISFISGDNADEEVLYAWQVDESTSPDTYVEQTDEFNSAATGDCNPFPATEAVNDFFALGSRRKFTKLSIDVGTAGTTGVVAWEYWDSSTWSSLSATDGTNSFKNSGVNTVTWTMPTDWAALDLNDGEELYYVRARITTTYGTDPVLDEGSVQDTVEHHVHWPAAGTFSATSLLFFGHAPAGAPKWHGEFSPASGNLIVNNGGTPTSDTAENEIEDRSSGTVTVNTVVTIELTNVVEGTQCAILADAGGPETEGTVLLNTAANSSGVAQDTAYNYLGSDQPIIYLARSSGTPAAILRNDAGAATDYTDEARDRATTSDVNFLPASPSDGDYTAFGGLTTFGRINTKLTTAGSGYTENWEYWNGAWTALSNVTGNLASTGEREITFDVPSGWTTKTETGRSGSFYYVRCRISGSFSPNSPIGDYVTLDVTKYKPFRGTGTIDDAGFSVAVPQQEQGVLND